MLSRERTPMPRRGFLTGLASLPLIGGSIALVGRPTAAAAPVTADLLWSYKNWLRAEHHMASFELARHDIALTSEIEKITVFGTPGDRYHLGWQGRGPAGWIDAPQPSTRAAIVLSAVGCPLAVEG